MEHSLNTQFLEKGQHVPNLPLRGFGEKYAHTLFLRVRATRVTSMCVCTKKDDV